VHGRTKVALDFLTNRAKCGYGNRRRICSTRFRYCVAQIDVYAACNSGNSLQWVGRLLSKTDFVLVHSDLLHILAGKPSAIAPRLFVSSPVDSERPDSCRSVTIALRHAKISVMLPAERASRVFFSDSEFRGQRSSRCRRGGHLDEG